MMPAHALTKCEWHLPAPQGSRNASIPGNLLRSTLLLQGQKSAEPRKQLLEWGMFGVGLKSLIIVGE